MNATTPWWTCLEAIPGLSAVAAVWQYWLGQDFSRFREAFLSPQNEVLARSVPCPSECGCWHEVVRHGPDDIVGVCRCDSWHCDDLHLSRQDITLWRVDLHRLGRALGQAFGLNTRVAPLGLANSLQIGSWSAAAVPVVLTIPSSESTLLHLIHILLGRWKQPFILLTPTAQYFGAAARELVAGASSGWFPIENTTVFTAAGTLALRETPGSLLARFTPQPTDEVDEGVARRAFALVAQLDSGPVARPPSAMTVFRLYCFEELSAGQVARKCHCSKPTVLSRLKQIRQATGLAPATLRRYSGHFYTMEDQWAEPRARRIRPQGLLDEE